MMTVDRGSLFIDGWVSTEFPAWATNRIAWRTAGLTIAGDTDYAEKFLDALHIV